MSPIKKWRCTVCGYEHEGPFPPEACPVCGQGPEAFELLGEVVQVANSAFQGNLLIVGAGIAGLAAAAAARKTAPGCRITLFNAEQGAPYQRLNLTRYLAGAVAKASLPVHPAEWYAEQRIELVGGRVASLDVAAKRLVLADGAALSWDRLVLATGANANRPLIPGSELPGVQVCRTLADADAILSRAVAGTRVVVVGGGVLGLEKAGALAGRGCQVQVLELAPSLMSRQLDAGGGACLARHLARVGIEVLTGVGVVRLTGTGRVEGVELRDGRVLPAGLVLLAAGIRAETSLAAAAGLACGKLAIRVDDALRTSAADVWAAGDCCEHAERAYGLWSVSQHQGTVAGTNAAGGSAAFTGQKPTVRLKVLAADVVGIGPVAPAPDDRVLLDERPDVYRRLLVRQGRLAGAILVGDGFGAEALGSAVEAGKEVPAGDVEAVITALAGGRLKGATGF